jgi:hypothetical protein
MNVMNEMYEMNIMYIERIIKNKYYYYKIDRITIWRQ